MKKRQVTKLGMRIGAVIVIGLSSALAGCDLWSKEPEIYQGEIVHPSPYQAPFSLKEKGASVEVLVRVGSEESLEVGLFALRDKKWNSWDEEYKRYWVLIPSGTKYLKPNGGYGPSPKIRPFKLRVQIDPVDSTVNAHLDKSIVVNDSSFMRSSKTHYLDFLDVAGVLGGTAPGIYRVHITNLEARPDVDWIPMEIYIGQSTGHNK